MYEETRKFEEFSGVNKVDTLLTMIRAISKEIVGEEIEDKYEEIADVEDNNKIVFIDGGQAEILQAANYSLQLIRTAAVMFKTNKKVRSKRKEFYVLIKTEGDKYKTELFGKGINLEIDAYDETIREGKERIEVSKIGNVIRRFAEIELAKEMIDELGTEDIIVLDGSLSTRYNGEKERIKGLYSEAEKKGVIVSALAKTTRIITPKGNCLISQISQKAKNSSWYYPITENNAIVKLNPSSKYLFELGVNNTQKVHFNRVLSVLKANSKDAVFPGYPYGLLLVDQLARVSTDEKEQIFLQLRIKAGKKWALIQNSLNAVNSHEILDNVS